MPIPGFPNPMRQRGTKLLRKLFGIPSQRLSTARIKKPARRTSLNTGLNDRFFVRAADSESAVNGCLIAGHSDRSSSTRRSPDPSGRGRGWKTLDSAAFGGCQMFSQSGLVSGSLVLMNQVLRRRLVDSLGNLSEQLFLFLKRTRPCCMPVPHSLAGSM